MATSHTQHLAATMNRERRRVELIGVRGAARIGRQVRRAVLAAFRSGESTTTPIRDLFGGVADVLRDAMVLGHLTGGLRSWMNAKDAIRRTRKALGVYDAALDITTKRASLTPDDLANLRSVYSTPATQAAFDAGVWVDQEVQRAIAISVQEGEHVRAGIKRLRETFDNLGIDLPGDVAIGRITSMQPYRLETLYRTNVQVAYAAGRWQTNQDPVINDILWGYEYTAVGDGRTRPTHKALDDTRLPKDDPQWGEIAPPNGWNCRCELIEIFKDDEELAVDEPPPATAVVDGATVVPGPDEGWAFNPGDVLGAAQPVAIGG